MDASVSRLTGLQENLILEAEPSCVLGGIVNGHSHREKRIEVPQKFKLELPYNLAIPLLATYPNKSKTPI